MMKYRKLRIAWSVGSGILCLLRLVLWVRSYWRDESINQITRLADGSSPIAARLIGMRSFHGTIRFFHAPDEPLIREWPGYGWDFNSGPIVLRRGEILPSILTFRREQFFSGFAITAPHWVMVTIFAALESIARHRQQLVRHHVHGGLVAAVVSLKDNPPSAR
jgi:hypothetical protein